MKETPIIMTGNHPKLILDGTETMARRVIKKLPILLPSEPTPELIELFKRMAVEQCPYIDHSVNIQPIPQIDKYGAGDDGKIYRIDKPKPVALKPWLGGYKNSYQMIRINSHNEYVHQLVCRAFYGLPPKELPDTRHLDGNSLNNRPQNLDWGTPKQNALDRSAHGKLNGENHPRARLSLDTVNEIRLRRKDFTIPELAQRYDVSKGTIEKVIYGQTWKADVQPALPNMERYVKSLGKMWVRETWAYQEIEMGSYSDFRVIYKADNPNEMERGNWKPSIHLSRKDSRITLENGQRMEVVRAPAHTADDYNPKWARIAPKWSNRIILPDDLIWHWDWDFILLGD